jgi:hypothetical protein
MDIHKVLVALLIQLLSVSSLASCPSADLTGDCRVDLADLAVLTGQWLEDGRNGLIVSFLLNGNPNWATTGQWQFGQPMGMGGDEYGYPDPTSGYTGSYVYGVNLDGDYSTAAGGPYTLTAGPFDCSTYPTVLLSFSGWLNTDSGEYVICSVEVSNDAYTWQTVWDNSGTVNEIVDNQWQQQVIDINSIASSSPAVYVRWSYQILNNRALPYSGWNIDDIELREWPVVPNVVGMALSEAEANIVAANYTMNGVYWNYSETIPAGLVCSQSPVSGTPFFPGNCVYLTVSTGEPVVVPNVVGATQAEAEASIVAVSLEVGTIVPVYNSTIPSGNVVSLTPVAGSNVNVDSKVNMRISKGPYLFVELTDITWSPITDPGFTGEMSKHETTNGQYCQFLNAALASSLITVHTDNKVYATSDTNHSQPYFSTEAASSYSQITYSGSTFSVRSRDGYTMANHPVVMVSWYGATAFCNYYGYRLPTKLEWQAVADYDGTYIYGCGTSIDVSKANYNLDSGIKANPFDLTSYPFTSDVSDYPAYGYGMCDMAGNASEWTGTFSGSDPVTCGGSWDLFEVHCRVSQQLVPGYGPSLMIYRISFRACR